MRKSMQIAVVPGSTWRQFTHRDDWQHWAWRQGHAMWTDLRNVPRYVCRCLLGLVLLYGLIGLWALMGDGVLPSMSPLAGFDPYRISSARCIDATTMPEARWQGLSPALAILDVVNPTVARWMREKHAHGLVVFTDHMSPGGDASSASAKYDMLRGHFVVRRELFCENDGTIAAILCHEYRHSRQNYGKFGLFIASSLIHRGGDLAILENDALLYEHEAQRAIFGPSRSAERELAAWQESGND